MTARIGDSLGMIVVFIALLMARSALIIEDHQSSGGTEVILPHACTEKEIMQMGDGRDVFVRYLPNSESYINQTSISDEGHLRREIVDLMSKRSERVIWFGADETLDYGEVAEVLSQFQRETPGLTVLLTTKKQTGPLIHGRVDHSGKYEILCPPPITTQFSTE